MVELVIAWNGKSMGKKIRIGQRTIFEKRVLTSLARKMPKNVGHSAMHSHFWLLASFFPWMGGCFCSAGDWVVFLAFLELLVHFPFTFLEVSCVFTMAVKSHSRFWKSH